MPQNAPQTAPRDSKVAPREDLTHNARTDDAHPAEPEPGRTTPDDVRRERARTDTGPGKQAAPAPKNSSGTGLAVAITVVLVLAALVALYQFVLTDEPVEGVTTGANTAAHTLVAGADRPKRTSYER